MKKVINSSRVPKARRTRASGASPEASGESIQPLLFEVGWEVCNPVGGIYTVLRSKAPSMIARWDQRYCLIGPYNAAAAEVEFEPVAPTGIMSDTLGKLQAKGIKAHYGHWLVTGRPYVVLLDYLSAFDHLAEVKYQLWSDHGIELPSDDELLNNVVAFAQACKILLGVVARSEKPARPIIAHFHEWMAGAAIPLLRHDNWSGSIVFTTHATLLGRYLAMNDDQFYDHLPFYNDADQATQYRVESQHRLERAATHGAQVFTTVSDVTADECRYLLGRRPDMLLPNGLNIQRFSAIHEFQNLHRQNKKKIHEFTIGHFFSSYNFELDNTLYFFTSGRFEYRNKGMDLTIDALAKLNHRLRQEKLGVTVVAFIITKQPVHSIDIRALQSRAMLDEFRTIADAMAEQVGEKIFQAAAEGHVPELDSLVEDYWRLRLRRAIQTWRRSEPPGIVSHDLVDDQSDPVLNQLRACRLWNQEDDPVKVVYHPDFINPSNPLFGMEYDQFVRGCHVGIFPSYYEPWGYTPQESIALGVPAITSDLSGFGSYLKQLLPDHEEMGLYVMRRRNHGFTEVAEQLADRLIQFCRLNRRQRIALRNRVETFSEHFDWHNLALRYHEAHELALDRIKVDQH